ncbi:MAG: PAS domain-containing protein [Marinagarivorans sp.]|nr:PAS domain-containing protein [Marinagarivorans sp.]
MNRVWLKRLRHKLLSWRTSNIEDRDTLAKHRRIFRGANNYGYFDWDLAANHIDWSGGYWARLGYSPAEVDHISLTQNYYDYVHPDDVETLKQALRRIFREDKLIEILYRVRKKNGGWVWTEIHAEASRDDNGWVYYVSGIALDITLRKQAEDALLQNEARHARIIKASNDGFWEWSAVQGGFTFYNRCWELLGFTENDDVVSSGVDRFQSWRKRMHPDDGERFDLAIEDHIQRKLPFDVEYRIRHKEGHWTWIRGRGQAYFDRHGLPLHMSGTNMSITDLKLAEERVLAAKEQAEFANRAKSDFLSSMSHELRTPLNAILGFAHLLESDLALASEQRCNVAEISKAGRYLLSLIGDVLDLAKIEAGRMEVSLEPVCPVGLMLECRNYLQPSADENSITITIIDQLKIPQYVHADRVRLKQVFLNLLSNAVKYNRYGGNVTAICTITDEGRLRIAFEDTGPGIPEARQNEVFEPFCRLGAEQSDIEGTGVGLVITRQLVQQMQGEMGFYNRPQGGCCFWLELRLYIEGDNAPKVPIVEPSNVLSIDLSQRRILYIEDNAANQRLIQLLFARHHCLDVAIASDAFKGVFEARARCPDLILLDINLPGMNGYEALEILKSDPLTRDIPVIALSANAMTYDRDKGLEAGFYEYLTKPLDVALFISVLNTLWSKSEFEYSPVAETSNSSLFEYESLN